MSESIIIVKDLVYEYADGTIALDGINLDIKAGEKIAIMGANGSGKSTLFLSLNGVLQPKKGKVLYKDKPIDYSRKGLLDLRSKIQIVFQDPDQQLFLAGVYEEISFGIMNLGVTKEEARKRVDTVIRELEITPFSHKPTHFLSGGQKKQVSIADILVMEPEVVILDEPAAALDPKHATIVKNIVDKLSKKGITVLLSTHIVDNALSWADKVILLKDGKVLKIDKPEKIFSDDQLLESTNLAKPDVIRMYEFMCQKGMIKKDVPIPRTMEELFAIIS